MARDPHFDTLVADLRALGGALAGPSVDDDVVGAVMTRVRQLPSPAPETAPRRLAGVLVLVASTRRRVLALVTVALLALLLPTPVRAAVLDWFGFEGVIVRQDPSRAPSVAPDPPSASTTISMTEARKLVAFEPVLLAELGPPQGVEVSRDRRVLSTTWSRPQEGTIRLDQFDGRLDYAFAKTAPGVHFTSVGDDFALWFEKPHEVVVLNRDGTRRTETARLAGHTLIWEHGGVTLRLEGDLGLDRAVEIALSAT